MTKLFTSNEIRGRHRQKRYTDYYSNVLLEPIDQWLGTIRCVGQFWRTGEVNAKIQHRTTDERECTTLQLDCSASIIINVQSPDHMRFALNIYWFKVFFHSRLRALHDCSSAEISKLFKKTITVGQDLRVTKYKLH